MHNKLVLSTVIAINYSHCYSNPQTISQYSSMKWRPRAFESPSKVAGLEKRLLARIRPRLLRHFLISDSSQSRHLTIKQQGSNPSLDSNSRILFESSSPVASVILNSITMIFGPAACSCKLYILVISLIFIIQTGKDFDF